MFRRSSRTCSRKGHENREASTYCVKCEEFFCSECEATHRTFLPRHAKHVRKAEGDSPVFTGRCAKPDHYESPLVYFCQMHNALCCAECRGPGGAHSDCKVVPLRKLDVEALRKTFSADLTALEAEVRTVGSKEQDVGTRIAEFKQKKDEFDKDIEAAHTAITATFNKMRSALDSREADLMKQLEGIQDEGDASSDVLGFSVEDLRREAEQVLRAGRLAAAESWDNEHLAEMVNTVSNVRAETTKIRDITKNIEAATANFPKVTFIDNSTEGIAAIESVGTVRSIRSSGSKYVGRWRECPECSVTLRDPTVVVAVGGCRACAIAEDPLPTKAVTKWRIKFLNNGDGWWLWIGVAPQSINLKSHSNDTECGWYLNTYNSTLYSGPPHKYNSKKYAKDAAKDLGIGSFLDVIMDTTDGTLSFSRGTTNFGPAYTRIPLNEALYPAVIFNCTKHSVQILPLDE